MWVMLLVLTRNKLRKKETTALKNQRPRHLFVIIYKGLLPLLQYFN